MKVEYDVNVTVKGVAEEGDPADEIFAAIGYAYPMLGACLLGDPHPQVDLVVGHIISSKKVGTTVFHVRLRLRAAADSDVGEEQVRAAVKEKMTEALDSMADGQIDVFTATGVVVDRVVPVKPGW